MFAIQIIIAGTTDNQTGEHPHASVDTVNAPLPEELPMDDLVQWLGQQYDEEQHAAEEALKRTTTTRRMIGGEWVEDTVQPPEWRRSAWSPTRVLSEINAKRQLLDEHQDVNDGSCGTCVAGQWGYPTHGGSSPQDYPCRTLRLLAEPYLEHPDFPEAYRP